MGSFKDFGHGGCSVSWLLGAELGVLGFGVHGLDRNFAQHRRAKLWCAGISVGLR
jgi:hypothetical protein